MIVDAAIERFFLHSDDPAEADAFYALTSNTRLADGSRRSSSSSTAGSTRTSL
jgi:hypothetical protein